MVTTKHCVKCYLYWIFPYWLDLDTDEVEEIDCWFNVYFRWLAEVIEICFLPIWSLSGKEPQYILHLPKKSIEIIQDYENQNQK